MPFLVGRVPQHETWRLEQFSRAYVKAVAAAAACTYARTHVDNDAVDVTLRRRTVGTVRRSPQLEVQLKATTLDCINDDHVAFALDVATYNKLRDPDCAVPHMLVLVVMNPDVENWYRHSESELSMLRCGYWVSLRDLPVSTNTYTETVHLPRAQVFDPAGLDAIFTRLADGYDL